MEPNSKIQSLQIAILVVGTHGDVQPFVAIGQQLKRDGHRVRLATHELYKDYVLESGLKFYPLSGDPKKLAACTSALIYNISFMHCHRYGQDCWKIDTS